MKAVFLATTGGPEVPRPRPSEVRRWRQVRLQPVRLHNLHLARAGTTDSTQQPFPVTNGRQLPTGAAPTPATQLL